MGGSANISQLGDWQRNRGLIGGVVVSSIELVHTPWTGGIMVVAAVVLTGFLPN
jgi:hypothetical protein